MSINFTATLTVLSRYFDENGKLEHESTVIEQALDCGSYRALRHICPVNDNCIEDCGAITVSIEHAMHWLVTAFVPYASAPFQVKAAHSYLCSVASNLTSTDDNPIYVEITWG